MSGTRRGARGSGSNAGAVARVELTGVSSYRRRLQHRSPHGAKRNAGTTLRSGQALPGLRSAPSGLRLLKTASRQSLRSSLRCFDQAITRAALPAFLRQPASNPRRPPGQSMPGHVVDRIEKLFFAERLDQIVPDSGAEGAGTNLVVWICRDQNRRNGVAPRG